MLSRDVSSDNATAQERLSILADEFTFQARIKDADLAVPQPIREIGSHPDVLGVIWMAYAVRLEWVLIRLRVFPDKVSGMLKAVDDGIFTVTDGICHDGPQGVNWDSEIDEFQGRGTADGI